VLAAGLLEQVMGQSAGVIEAAQGALQHRGPLRCRRRVAKAGV